MTNLTSYTTKLLEFQVPIFDQALKDKKPFDEALALARSEPWPAGLAEAKLIQSTWYVGPGEDKEEEKRKRALRLEDEKRASRKRKALEKLQKMAAWDPTHAYDPATDCIFITIHHVDWEGKVIREEYEQHGAMISRSKRAFTGTTVVTPDGERVRSVLTMMDALNHSIMYMAEQQAQSGLRVTREVKDAIFLPLAQRKVFGAAKDRGLSDADALAVAKGTRTEFKP